MSLFAENIVALGRLQPDLLHTLQAATDTHCRLEQARNGSLTLVYSHAAGDNYLHSRFNPEKEALAQLQAIDLKEGHIVILGTGLGYLLQSVMAFKPPATRVLVIEPDLAIAKQTLHTVPWSTYLSRSDFHFCFGAEAAQLGTAVARFVHLITFKQLTFITQPAEEQLFPARMAELRQTIDREVRTMLLDFITHVAEVSIVPRNVLKNLPYILQTRPIHTLYQRFAGAPGIIVAAGPSLDRNILQLHRVCDRGIIIAVGTALKPLLARGIQPHFTAVVDPSYKNYLHLQGEQQSLQHFVIAEMGVAQPIYRDFHSKIFSLSLGKPITNLIEELYQPFGRLDAWGSVASLALHFAVFAGLDPIILAGHDFAFTDMHQHCHGTAWEEQWQALDLADDDLQRVDRQSINANNQVVDVQDIFNEYTLTSDRLLLYKDFLLKTIARFPGTRFINASEGGIVHEIPLLPLDDAITTFFGDRPPLDIAALNQIPPVSAGNRTPLTDFLTAKSALLASYGTEVQAFLKETDSPATAEATASLIARAQTLWKKLYDDVQAGELVEMWSQGPIYQLLKKLHDVQAQAPVQAEAIKIAAYAHYFKNVLPLIHEINLCLSQSAAQLTEQP